MPNRPVKQAQRFADVCQDSLRRDNAKWLELELEQIWCMLHEAASAVPILAGRMDQILKKRMCWVHMVPGKQFIPVLLAVNQLCYSCESTLCNKSTKPGQLRSKHASGLLTHLRQSSCVVTFISLVIFHSLSLLRPCIRGFLCACLIPNPRWLRLASSQQAFWSLAIQSWTLTEACGKTVSL